LPQNRDGFQTAHAGHMKIGKNEIDLASLFQVAGDRLRPAARDDRTIAIRFENLTGHEPNRLLIVNNENQFAFAFWRLHGNPILDGQRADHIGVSREIDLELRTLSHFALKLDMTFVAFHDTHYGRQAQTRPFIELFCCEKWVEDLVSY